MKIESPYKYCGGACYALKDKKRKPDILGKRDGEISRLLKLKIKDIR
jgi:hypothetical protein